MNYLRLNDCAVPGHELRISGSFDIKKADLSGDSSTTAKASEGTKAKKFSVSTCINYTAESDLQALVRVAQAEDDGIAALYHHQPHGQRHGGSAGHFFRPGQSG